MSYLQTIKRLHESIKNNSEISEKDKAKAEAVNSNTQLYKQAGNSIVVDVLVHLINSCLTDNGEVQPKIGEQIRLF